ncbi:MAG TPA: tetraacyldisaccharide 4'-kinase [Acidobacteriota bacterium]|nr:tetraacyldisaccharide 4'-kinase [Acidobacteriota bacterium]
MPGAMLSRIRNALYDHGWLSVTRPRAFVISIGNLTWGGTGKTSLAAHLADHLCCRGYRVAILSRGYGRRSKGVVVVSNGDSMCCDWQTAGDEPYWLGQTVPKAMVVVAENRVEGLKALEPFTPDVILLDDGFQHRRIARDIDLLLIDASENLLRQRVLPFGKLREPIDSIERASAIVLTHASRAHTSTLDWIVSHARAPVFHADYVPVRNDLAGKKLAAFCALGSPQHFFDMLEQAGATLVFHQDFRDHHVYTGPELALLNANAERAGAEALATTAKDAVKIAPDAFRLPLCVVEATLKLQEEERLFQFLHERLPAPVAVTKES